MNIKLWDKDNKYLWGQLENSKFRIWDKDNEYIWGKLEGTDIKLWHESDKYIWGRLEGSDIKLWDENNNYIRGLSLLDKKTKKFKNFKAFTYEGSLSNNDVLSLFKDSRNRIWIGTSYGLT